MLRKLLLAITSLFLLNVVLVAQDGKLRGKATDKESGEPLIGANVLVEGTNLGASSDINGDYVILSVPPGVHTLKASYIGYASYTISNVRVSANLTTTVDFQLSSTAIQLQAVEVIAERPLIQRNTTNTVRLQTQDDIKNIPFRGLAGILALNAGVVLQDGNLYVRGGRSGEVAFFLEGANTTNPLTNLQSVSVIQEAIEEVQLQAGGYTAEFGGSNSAIVRTTLRSGSPDYHATISYQTDDFAKPGKKYLGGSSFGFRNGVVTLSGPLGMKDLRFFVAGQHNYIRDRAQRWLVPFSFEGLRVDDRDARYNRNLPLNQQALLPGAVAFQENLVPKNYREDNSAQGTVTYDLQPLKFRFAGSYNVTQLPSGSNWPDALANIFRQDRNRLRDIKTSFAEVRMSHVLNPTTFYEVGVSFQNIADRTFDRTLEKASLSTPLPALKVGGQDYVPKFRDNWNQYPDSLANASVGFTGFKRRFEGPDNWRTIFNFQFDDPNAPNNRYDLSNQQGFGFTADLTSQVSPNYELKAGGKIDSWTLRNYTVFDISAAMRFLYGDNGKNPQSFKDQDELRFRLGQSAGRRINHYGYDVFGNDLDSGPDAAKKPLFASAYIQNKFEYKDLILNVGARYELFDTKARVFPNAQKFEESFDTGNDIIDDSKLVDVEPFSLVLPRVSFSFPVTDNTVFYAMYGKYAQMPALNQLFRGLNNLSRTVSIATRGNAYLTPIGFLMKPERTTQYEMGFRQTLSDNFALTVSGFYKDLRDQLAVRSFVDDRGSKLFTSYLNEDFGTVKGLELTLELRRTNRLATKLSYTLSDARGTSASPDQAFGAIEQNIGRPSNFINPLDFNQSHRGTFLLDYRFAKGDGGPILEGLGVNALLTFNSGHAYTKIKEPNEIGQANAWNVGTYPLVDPRFRFPTEPINNSTTPWVFNVDLNVSKMVWVGDIAVELYANVLNLFNTKHVLNVYPSTGTPYDDGWFTSPASAGFLTVPNYAAFYKAINLDNQWAYMDSFRGNSPVGGNELFGIPRQVRFGVRLEI